MFKQVLINRKGLSPNKLMGKGRKEVLTLNEQKRDKFNMVEK